MMRPLCWASGDHLLNDLVEPFGGEIAIKTVVDFGDWSPIADAETAVDDLDRQFAVGRRVAITNPMPIREFLDELLRSSDVAGHTVAKQHEVVAARLGPEVSVEGEQSVDSIRGRPEMLSDDLSGLKRDPTEVFVDFLECAEDEFLSLLIILRFEVRHNLANDRKIDLLAVR